MATSKVTVVALLLTNFLPLADASAFLETRADEYITKKDVEQTLLSELCGAGVSSSSTKLRTIEEELRPMYAALPKNGQGTLDPPVVRYALHRYFVQKHGWYMLGLDPAGGAWESAAPSVIMKDKAPAYIQSLFEERLHGQGLGLNELAVFASVLSDLVHKEAMGGVYRVFSGLQLPTIGPVSQYWSKQAVKAYLMLYLIGGNLTLTDASQFDILEKELLEIYPDWPGTYMWLEDSRLTHNLMLRDQRNPFVPQRETFDSSVAFVEELGHHFGSFQDLECKALKGKLVELEHQGTGRVRLPRFYAGGVNGDWTLSESVQYLRNLGALDETDPNKPSVVIPNYLTSRTNCLTASGFYSVCCSDECEGLRQHLEEHVASPSAPPARIAEVVAQLHSDTVDAPRNLSSTLLARLDEVAQFHTGQVPLHGRLFAQWMHHAYPRECPFPHVSGTISPMSPEDWMSQNGVDNVEATVEEMQLHHSRLEHEASIEDDTDDSLPWNHVEELVGRHHHSDVAGRRSWLSVLLRAVMAAAALASFASPLLRASKAAVSSSTPSKAESLLV